MTEPFLDILKRRRSIRKFAECPVEPEKRDQLLEAALRAPSSRGRAPLEFIVAEESNLLQELGKSKRNGSAFLATAPLAIVVAADPDKSDVWIEDFSIAAILIQLAATSLGLGSCWVQIRLREQDAARHSSNDFLVKLLGLPARYQVGAIIGIGYPGEEIPGHPRSVLDWSKLHSTRYGRALTKDQA